LDVPLYPGILLIADVGLAVLLFLVAPILGALMAAAALSVVATGVLRARGDVPFRPRSERSFDG
jgi:hypothetical protein